MKRKKSMGRAILLWMLCFFFMIPQIQGQAAPVLGSQIQAEQMENQLGEEGRKALLKIIKKQPVYALVYQCNQAEIKKQPSLEGKTVKKVHAGHQVTITDIQFAEGMFWYQITTLVAGKEYQGYLPKEFLISGDTRLKQWEEKWMAFPENTMFSAEKQGAGTTDLSTFPESYRPYIQELLAAHPNWTFVPLNTGLDWSVVIENEMYPARNLLPVDCMDTWKVSNDILSAPHWVQASESIVRYYMDPRNYLNEESVFSLELLSFNKESHTLSGIESVVKNTFMHHANLEGTDMTYAEAFLKIGEELNISPYHLAGRVRQEQGAGNSPLISGTHPGYEGFYNYYNIQASGITYDEILANGFKEAQDAGWTTRYAALYGGSQKVGNNYIRVGQNTLYLQKFDVDNSDGILYWHQYMQNLLAAYSEGKSVKRGYEEMGALNNAFVFSVPVYKNMPSQAIKMPTDTLEQPSLAGSVKKLTNVHLSWTEIPGAQGYEIFRSPKEQGEYQQVATLTSVGILNYTDKVPVNQRFYYKVRGYKTFLGVTAYSPDSPVVMVSSSVAKTDWKKIQPSSYAKVTLEWEKAKEVTGYQIYRKESSQSNYEKIASIKGGGVLHYQDTTVIPNKSYDYKIRAYEVLEGKTYYSSFCPPQQVSLKMKKTNATSAVLDSKGNMVIRWEKDTLSSGYQIYRKEGSSQKFTLLAEVSGGQKGSYTDKEVEDNTLYTYKVRSFQKIESGKKYSGFSKILSGGVKVTPPKAKTPAKATTSGITLQWGKNPISSGYEIQKKTGAEWETVFTTKKNINQKTITNLVSGTSYTFRIKAFVTVKEKTYESSYVTIKGATAPDTPQVHTVTSKKKQQLFVKWDAVKGATGYQVQISRNQNFKKLKRYKTTTYEIKKGSTVSKTIKKLSGKKKYYLRVRGYKVLGKQKVYGSWSEKKSIVIK